MGLLHPLLLRSFLLPHDVAATVLELLLELLFLFFHELPWRQDSGSWTESHFLSLVLLESNHSLFHLFQILLHDSGLCLELAICVLDVSLKKLLANILKSGIFWLLLHYFFKLVTLHIRMFPDERFLFVAESLLKRLTKFVLLLLSICL